MHYIQEKVIRNKHIKLHYNKMYVNQRVRCKNCFFARCSDVFMLSYRFMYDCDTFAHLAVSDHLSGLWDTPPACLSCSVNSQLEL